MRGKIIFLLVAMLIWASLPTFANVISEDVTYWYKTDPNNMLQWIVNPTTEQLEPLLPYLLIKVQQTVYDQTQSAEILGAQNIQCPRGGYLYAYSVTNLNYAPGINRFAVSWGVAPLLVTTSRATPGYWLVDNNSLVPEWYSIPCNIPGIYKGETVGGFWAVANTGVDERVLAIVGSACISGNVECLYGETSGPTVPEPTSILALIAGTSILRMRIKRQTKR